MGSLHRGVGLRQRGAGQCRGLGQQQDGGRGRDMGRRVRAEGVGTCTTQSKYARERNETKSAVCTLEMQLSTSLETASGTAKASSTVITLPTKSCAVGIGDTAWAVR